MIFNERMETMEHKRLQELQLERLQATVKRVVERVPFYEAAFAAAGVAPNDIRSLDDVAKLPFTVKKDLRDQYPFGLFACDRAEVARIHGSSGTKGKPTVVGYTKQDLANWAEIVARAICLAGGRPGDLFHNAYGYGLFTGGLGLHAGAEVMGATVVPVSGGQTARQITLIQDFEPRGISCTPSYALNIAEEMVRQGLDPSATTLQYGIFGAEPWTEEMRQTLERVWGLKAIDIYGLSEVMGPGVACECCEEQNGLHIAEDHFYAEIIDPETLEPLPEGEFGELVFTSLTKQALPVIRYRTGDISALTSKPCSCGRTMRRMTRIKGRIDDMLIIRGVNVFPSEMEAVLLTVPELAPHYQVVLSRDGALDSVELQVEMQSEPASCSEAELTNRVGHLLKEALGVSIGLKVHPPQTIARSEGKAVRIVDRRQ
ncbi:phenylacetate--CoA ligase family protein [Tumebacillus permanentifrigoris]|uniref:Phenylacetate-coenzyme A ligase n=1 Tax=Tumebacillus permanentifrigoris TaxID=378543 RepID=A0A316D889_9BACL|nr:AMP-binding protein [Tumebacillus permanentifrigoris]PWK10271.1 phenylacetate-CoA ligase [Tumebacillus permanentifrigoris]